MSPRNRHTVRLIIAVLTAGCSGPSVDTASDGAETHAGPRPVRIVSLMPAATEILFALEADDRLVGRTRWGVHPPEAEQIPSVGDGMRPSLEAVLARSPDLVVMYDGEANRDALGRLETLGVPTLALRHDTVGDLERNIGVLGKVVGCVGGARRLAAFVRAGLAQVAEATTTFPRVRVYYESWADPPMTIGRGSFIDSLVLVAGGDNVFGDLEGSAPRVSLEAILARAPERILVAVPRAALDDVPEMSARRGWRELDAVRRGRIGRLDQDLVTRLGPRLADAAWDIAKGVHPGLVRPVSSPWVPSCSA